MALTKSSTRRVDTPSTYAWQITATSACSARRRGINRNSGEYTPWRSFGTAKSIVPTRVSHGRCRYPLREFSRSSVRSA
jgi:hypothetical protein